MSRHAVAAALAALSLVACESEEEEGSATMLPGSNCISCHDGSGEASRFTAAGTVYARGDAAANEGLAGATVTLVGSGGGQTVTLTTNSAGNFFTGAPLTPPIAVTVALGADTAGMAGATGDCAACHDVGTGVSPARVHVGSCGACHTN